MLGEVIYYYGYGGDSAHAVEDIEPRSRGSVLRMASGNNHVQSRNFTHLTSLAY